MSKNRSSKARNKAQGLIGKEFICRTAGTFAEKRVEYTAGRDLFNKVKGMLNLSEDEEKALEHAARHIKPYYEKYGYGAVAAYEAYIKDDPEYETLRQEVETSKIVKFKPVRADFTSVGIWKARHENRDVYACSSRALGVSALLQLGVAMAQAVQALDPNCKNDLLAFGLM